jgi:hypothetical protein
MLETLPRLSNQARMHMLQTILLWLLGIPFVLAVTFAFLAGSSLVIQSIDLLGKEWQKRVCSFGFLRPHTWSNWTSTELAITQHYTERESKKLNEGANIGRVGPSSTEIRECETRWCMNCNAKSFMIPGFVKKYRANPAVYYQGHEMYYRW